MTPDGPAPGVKYWETGHGVKMRVPTGAYKYYRLDYKMGGRRVVRSVGGDWKAAWAEAARVDELVAADSGHAGELSVESAMNAWVEHNQDGWSERYTEDNVRMLTDIVFPVIGHLALGTLTRTQVRDVMATQVSDSGKRKVRDLLSSFVGWASDEGWVTLPPERIVPPTGRKTTKGVALVDPAEIPETSDILALYTVMTQPRQYQSKHARKAFTPPEHWGYMVLVGAFCGLRQGEVFGLRGGDVNGDVLNIDEQVQILNHRPVAGLDPKGGRHRKVIIPENVEGIPLRDWLVTRAKLVGKDGLMFPTQSGGLWRRNNFGRDVWLPARRTAWADHEDWTFHSLRHHYCRWLLERGVDAKDVSLMAGHSSVRVTLDMYVGHTASAFDRVRAAL